MIVHRFFFNDTATTEIYTLSLHDALPIYGAKARALAFVVGFLDELTEALGDPARLRELVERSEEHTSELQSPDHLVCRLLLEKKKNASLGIRGMGVACSSHQLLLPLFRGG